jgi:hypothetical protein
MNTTEKGTSSPLPSPPLRGREGVVRRRDRVDLVDRVDRMETEGGSRRFEKYRRVIMKKMVMGLKFFGNAVRFPGAAKSS